MSTLYLDAGPTGSPKVMLATTAYDSPDASYTFSIARSREALRAAGLPSAYLLLSGNAHVDDARNAVLREFLASDCTDLVFLDADVSWEPEALIRLCQYDCDLVGGVYPYRRHTGKEGMPVRHLSGSEPDAEGLLEVEGLPTGFMRIRRIVIERLLCDAAVFHKNGPIPLLFERGLENGLRVGGDLNFCAKWRACGGKVFAASELRLGHCGKQVIRDSLAGHSRRTAGTALRHAATEIRAGRENPDLFAECVKAIDNPWGAQADFLSLAVGLARKAQGPIIETGSGLTTILMAAATDQEVWCLEHSDYYAAVLEEMTASAGVGNVMRVHVPLKDDWYDLSEDMAVLPERFAAGLVDGPPRALGDRMKFFEVFGDRVNAVLCDDADDAGYLEKLTDWAGMNGRTVQYDDFRAALITNQQEQMQ